MCGRMPSSASPMGLLDPESAFAVLSSPQKLWAVNGAGKSKRHEQMVSLPYILHEWMCLNLRSSRANGWPRAIRLLVLHRRVPLPTLDCLSDKKLLEGFVQDNIPFPLLYCFLLVPFVSESPRWLLVKGRDAEALDVLKKFARLNGKKLPPNLVLSNPSRPKMVGAAKGEGGGPMVAEAEESLWKTKWAAQRMMLVMLAGFGVGFVYFGIQLNVENLNFNLYFTVALNAMMEFPAVFIGSVLLSFMNRRLLFSLSSIVAGVSCILCIFFARKNHGSRDGNKSGGSWAQLVIEGVGFMAASLAFDVMYIYCVELFPTNVRNFAVSILRQALMLGASIAPLLVAVGRLSPSISFLIFGSLSIFSGVLSLWLPETRNAPLYETLKQQEEQESLSRVSSDSGFELGKEVRS